MHIRSCNTNYINDLIDRCNERDSLWNDITTFLKECGYKYKYRVSDIVDVYSEMHSKHGKDFYATYNVRQIIKHFEPRLKKLYQ
jgi:predicted component of type VI protein secretion system